MRYLDGAKSGEASMAQSVATQAEIFGKLDEFIFEAAPKDAGSEFWKRFK